MKRYFEKGLKESRNEELFGQWMLIREDALINNEWIPFLAYESSRYSWIFLEKGFCEQYIGNELMRNTRYYFAKNEILFVLWEKKDEEDNMVECRAEYLVEKTEDADELILYQNTNPEIVYDPYYGVYNTRILLRKMPEEQDVSS